MENIISAITNTWKYPKSTLCGVVIGVVQAIAASPGNGVDWSGIKIALPTIILGALLRGGSK